MFENNFWPKIISELRKESIDVSSLVPSLIWSEICTKIKGHETSHEYPLKYMNLENYSYYHKILPEE